MSMSLGEFVGLRAEWNRRHGEAQAPPSDEEFDAAVLAARGYLQ